MKLILQLLQTIVVIFSTGVGMTAPSVAESLIRQTNVGVVRLGTPEPTKVIQSLEMIKTVEQYFDSVSKGCARVRFLEVRGVWRMPDHEGLEKADAKEPDRRQFVKAALTNVDVPGLANCAYVVIVTDAWVWPYTLIFPGSEFPMLLAASVVSLETDWGTVAHEVGHLLGLPDLYDQRLADKGLEAATRVGPWCLMSRSKLRLGLSGWSRLQLGWIPDEKIIRINRGEIASVRLDSLTTSGTNSLVVKIKLGASRYYLVEARTRVGADASLPHEGVLITCIDFYAADPSERVRVVDANPKTRSLEDALFDTTEGRNEFVDSLNGVYVAVCSRTTNGYEVFVRNSEDQQ